MLCAYQIEIIDRELDGILYQALHLAARGIPLLIGDRMVNQFIKTTTSPVLFLDKDQNRKTNTAVLNHGGLVINLNAEGQGFADNPPQVQINFARVINYTSKVCVWGQLQYDILCDLIPDEQREKVIITGHPSFDLASPRFNDYYRDQAIVGRYGEDYTLINTSFAMFNHQMGFDYYMKMLSGMDEWKVYGTPEHIEHLKKRCVHQERTALALIDLAKTIAQTYPDRHVIIRPHPAENPDFYLKRIEGFDKITVTSEGTVRKWISTAATVIHHDCTTGMEAALMGKLVLQFEPFEGIIGSMKTLQRVGHRTTSPSKILELMKSGVMPNETQAALHAQLRKYLANIDGNAGEAVATVAEALGKGFETILPGKFGLRKELKCWRKYASKLLRAHQPGRNGRKVRYALSKFARLRQDEVERRLARLAQFEPTLPEVDITRLCMNNFLITPKGMA